MSKPAFVPRLVVVSSLLFALQPKSSYAAPQSCEQLTQLILAKTKVTAAETVTAGTFIPPTVSAPYLVGDPAFYKQLPVFCRLRVTSSPSADSDIKIEVWLPVSGWNGRFRGQGNGGFAGGMDYRAMGLAVMEGYATAATDTGHTGGPFDASWALGHPEKIVDFAYRAIHEMTVVAKAMAGAFYGAAPKRAYFANCSNGGRQGLMEAQRFPEDYDGILAGAPANDWTHFQASALWVAQATTSDLSSYIPSRKIPAIAQAVLAACDLRDNVKDGVVNEPRKCAFDPATLACKHDDADSCLTGQQVTTLKNLYEGPHHSTGKQVFPGFSVGGEEGQNGWPLWITGNAPGRAVLLTVATGYFSRMVYGKTDWDYKHANFEEAVTASDDKFASVLNAVQTDMKAFKARGGKLIIYHGWSDAGISPLNSIKYYDSVVTTMGKAESDSFLRLYMVPGMHHCAGGPGADDFGQLVFSVPGTGFSQDHDAQHNIYVALERWVERGTAPHAVVASKHEDAGSMESVIMSRPLCPYPQVAKYKGSGDTNHATSFTCRADK